MAEKVYVGRGFTKKENHKYHVFQYNTSRDEWSHFLPHPIKWFAMAQFTGNLITVEGQGAAERGTIGKVYHFKEESWEWKEFLKPMPTARFCLSVATTQSAVIASLGATRTRGIKLIPCAIVEV